MNEKKSFWAQWHHVTDAEIVIPPFGHFVNFALTVSADPGGLSRTGNGGEEEGRR